MYSLPHILAGGHQIILSSFQPEEVIACINHHTSVSMFAAPTMVTRLIHSDAVGAMRPENIKCLQYGGAPMYVADLEEALAVFGPRLYQLYGQGESPMTITGLSKHLHLDDDMDGRLLRLGSVGYARSGTEVKIMNEAGDFLPAGVVGEVVTRSDCVMMGYWGDKSATDAAINQGWLRTGDIGVMHEDGLLTLHDRSKDLIISGGSNIYPREIEEILLRDPNVMECAVIGKRDTDWGEVPVAFIVLRDGMQVNSDQLDQLLLENIARFKRPREYYFVSELPKNNYGKVLKTVLRASLLISC
jgi:acyl-CoA synthetase (AMP-forming)/AMP-acid ligase II